MSTLRYLDPNPKGSPAILLLHGLGADGSSWALQFPDLIRAGFRPLAPDAAGFGRSPYDGRGWSLKRAAAQLADLLRGLGCGPAHVVGLSMGGAIAQRLALDYPDCVRSLALVSTFAALRPARWTGWFYFLQRFILVHTVGIPLQARFVAQRVFPGPENEIVRSLLVEQVTQADPRAYRAAMRALGFFDSRKRLGELKIPVLVVTGENDSTVSGPHQRELAARIGGARQVIIPGAGHALSVDQPQAFNDILLEFLGNNS